MTNAFAVQTVETLQRLVGNDHQAALLEILQHIHQLASLIHHLQSRCQLKRHKLALPTLQTIDVCPGGCRMLDYHIQSCLLKVAHCFCHIETGKLCLSCPDVCVHQLLLLGADGHSEWKKHQNGYHQKYPSHKFLHISWANLQKKSNLRFILNNFFCYVQKNSSF